MPVEGPSDRWCREHGLVNRFDVQLAHNQDDEEGTGGEAGHLGPPYAGRSICSSVRTKDRLGDALGRTATTRWSASAGVEPVTSAP